MHLRHNSGGGGNCCRRIVIAVGTASQPRVAHGVASIDGIETRHSSITEGMRRHIGGDGAPLYLVALRAAMGAFDGHRLREEMGRGEREHSGIDAHSQRAARSGDATFVPSKLAPNATLAPTT
eukprot:gene16303-15083_t